MLQKNLDFGSTRIRNPGLKSLNDSSGCNFEATGTKLGSNEQLYCNGRLEIGWKKITVSSGLISFDQHLNCGKGAIG